MHTLLTSLKKRKKGFAPLEKNSVSLSLSTNVRRFFSLRGERKTYFLTGFTLIELLIVIAIIAVLAIVTMIILNPAQLMRQARDSNRVFDLDTINHAIAITIADQPGISLGGTTSTIYISLPDPALSGAATSTCPNMGLPVLPAGWLYRCVSFQNLRNGNGTGWIPVNFQSVSSGSPLPILPIDPVNSTSSNSYYTYTPSLTQFEISTPFESNKYRMGGATDRATTDGGTQASSYEVGTNLSLNPMDIGDPTLVGYWRFDEDSGSDAADSSGGGHSQGVCAGNPAWVPGKIKKALRFGGNDCTRWTTSAFPSYNSITMLVWINSASSTQNRFVSEFGNGSYIGTNMMQNGDKISVDLKNGNSSCGALDSVAGVITPGTWQLIGFAYDGAVLTIYNNGQVVGTQSANCGLYTAMHFYTGWNSICGSNCGFNGTIDDVRVYDRALSGAEVQAYYNATK